MDNIELIFKAMNNSFIVLAVYVFLCTFAILLYLRIVSDDIRKILEKFEDLDE